MTIISVIPVQAGIQDQGNDKNKMEESKKQVIKY
jgi:hypothetical protein